MNERVAFIKKCADNKMTYREIGEQLGISKQRVCQIYQQHFNRKGRNKTPKVLVRCKNCGKIISLLPSMAKGRSFCSKKCFYRFKNQPLLHGTMSGYLYYGCRCKECQKANADYRMFLKQKKLSTAGGGDKE